MQLLASIRKISLHRSRLGANESRTVLQDRKSFRRDRNGLMEHLLGLHVELYRIRIQSAATHINRHHTGKLEVCVGQANHELVGSYENSALGFAIPEYDCCGIEIAAVHSHVERYTVDGRAGREQVCNRW